MLDNEQIYSHIPKRIINWSERDVDEWFRINEIELREEMGLSGEQFIKLTANRLLNEFGLSIFLTRKVIDWIQFEADTFDKYVAEMEKLKDKPSFTNQNYQQVQLQFIKTPVLQNESLQSSCKDDNLKNAVQKQLINIIIMNKHNSDSNLSLSSDCHSQENSSQPNQEYQAQSNQIDVKVNESQQLWSSIEQVNQDNVSKPIKYGKWRGTSSEENQVNSKLCKNYKNQNNLCQYFQSMSESLPIKVKMPISSHQKSPLLIDHLVENNGSQTKQDIETNKNIPQWDHGDHQYFQENSINFNKISHKQPFINNLLTCFSEQSNVKLVTSRLVMANGSILTAFYEDNLYQITKNSRIGRSTHNNIILKSEGVSRNHAEVLIEEEQDSKGNIQKMYYLRDIGSKYGTFIETDPQKPKRIAENEQYCIGKTTIRIDKLKLYKRKEKFDISISIIQSTKEQRSFQNRSFLTIGSRRREFIPKDQRSSQTTKRTTKDKRDLELQDNQIKHYHCRFVIISSWVYLQQVEGNIFQKLQKNIKYPLNKNQCKVKFGDGNVTFRMQQLFKTVLLDD